jgi:hypothetical protein
MPFLLRTTEWMKCSLSRQEFIRFNESAHSFNHRQDRRNSRARFLST